MARADSLQPESGMAAIKAENLGGSLRICFSGAWSRDASRPPLDPILRTLDSVPGRVTFEGAGVTSWDSSLLTAVVKLQARARAAGRTLDDSAMPKGLLRLLELIRASPEQAAPAEKRPGRLAKLGLASLVFFRDSLDSVTFLGESLQALAAGIRGKARCRSIDFGLLLQECGPEALPIITLLSLLVGMILAFLGSVQLKLFGAQLYVADLVAIGMVREMGALMTGIIMAGRTGSFFAAKLGAMQVNEEIDALVTTGFPPMEFLVLPRMVALFLMMPLLTLYADALGILGGALVGVGMLDLTGPQYFNETATAATLHDVAAGLIKSLVYGVVISLAGCRQGLRCGRSASAVGEATTRAVVLSIVGIIVWDSAITILYTLTGF